ncbi:MAG TPA: RDD family protein [Woeseiaceae bacterium]|nr:RDD family protein [Woeseiaceae bacterium]
MEDRLNIPSITGTDLVFDVAGPGGRSYAFIIDWHIRLLIALAWFLLASLIYAGSLSWAGVADDSLSGYLYIVALPAMVIYLLYHPVLEILMDGRTPGKRMAGIRIVARDGKAPGIGAHLVRNLFRLVDSLPFAYLIGFTSTLVTENNLRFGDLAAGTLLIYDAADEKLALKEVEAMHGARIGLQEAELVQELTARWDSLDSETRLDLGRKLLKRLEGDLPAGLSSEAVLSRLKTHLA